MPAPTVVPVPSGFVLRFKAGALPEYDPPGLRNYWPYRQIAPTPRQHEAKVRDWTRQLFDFRTPTANDGLSVDRYDFDDAAVLDTKVIEPQHVFIADIWPELFLSVIEVAYIRDNTAKYTKTEDHGDSYGIFTIPGTYTRLTACHQWGRFIVVAYTAPNWVVLVGTRDVSSGLYSWSAGVTIPGAGSLDADATLEAQLDQSLKLSIGGFVRYCYGLANDGTGDWVV